MRGENVVGLFSKKKCFEVGFEGWLVGALRPVNHKGLCQGLERLLQRYIAERTDKAEIRPEEQSEKAEGCRENLWNEIQVKGP